MYRFGRSVVDHFNDQEQLYRRYSKRDFSNGVILPSALKFPEKGENTGQSVNRSRFSKPQDVLWTETQRFTGWGVYAFPVGCLPARAKCSQTAQEYTFFAKHIPLRNNYAHSEIWCDELPRKNAEYKVPTKLVKKELRATIQKNSKTLITPSV